MDVHEPLTVTTGEASCAEGETGAPDVLVAPAPGTGWACLWFASRFGT